MSKITASKLARMSQREFVEIRQTVTEELQEIRTEIATLRNEFGALGRDLDQRLLTITDGLHLVLEEVDELAMRRASRRSQRTSRTLPKRRVR